MRSPFTKKMAEVADLLARSEGDYRLTCTADAGPGYWDLWYQIGQNTEVEHVQRVTATARALLSHQFIEPDPAQGPGAVGRRRYVLTDTGLSSLKQHFGVTAPYPSGVADA